MTNKEAKEKLYMEWQKFLEDNIDYAGISKTYKMAFKALDQEPNSDMVSRGVFEQVMWERDVAIEQLKELGYELGEKIRTTTTAGEGEVMYYPQVEGVTPTVVDVGKQDPCNTCGYEEGSIYCKEHCPHEAKMDDLVKLCIEQELRDCKTCIHSDKGHCAGTEKCHECMWESKYEQAPCGDAIDRKLVSAFIDGLISDDGEREKGLEYIRNMPPVNPTKTGWIPVSERLPEDLEPVNITWVNHEPEPYYHDIKDRNFVATGIYYRGQWYWYSTTCADYLGEYGSNEIDKVDDAVEIIAWMPLPKPYEPQEREDER